MSHLEGDKLEEPEFKWLKEKAGQSFKNAQFYESFLYEGVEYSLYDSVYLQVESEHAPCVGKLVRIWEDNKKSKMIRVHWFFRPSEIHYHLGDSKVLENELFLASGCGIGLVNISPLEAIVGKCNVVCTSTDCRNPQPSENEEKMADYVFYRVFDVQNFTILDQFNDTIGELKVEFVFNRKEIFRTLSSPKFELNKHARNATDFKGTMRLVSANSPNISPHSNGDCNYMAGYDNASEKQAYIAKEELSRDVKHGSFIREPTSTGKHTNLDVNSNEEEAATSIIDNRSASGGIIVGCKTNAERGKVIERKNPLKQAQFEDNVKSMKSHGLNDTSLNRGKFDGSSSEDREATSNIGNKNVYCVKNVDDTRLKGGKLNDKSSKDSGETSLPNSIISRSLLETQMNGATSFDANLKFEIDKDYGEPRKNVKPRNSYTILNEKISDVRITIPKTLESEHVAGFVSLQKDLKSTKCSNASREEPSRNNDSLVDEASKNKSHEVFERHGQVATHVEFSCDAASQLSKTRVYPPNREINHGHDSFKRKDLSSGEGSCLGEAPSKKAKLDGHNKPSKENSMEVIRKLKVKTREIGQEMTNHAHGACERKNSTLAKDSCVIGPSKKAKLDGSSKTFRSNKNDAEVEIHNNEDGKVEGEIFEVSPRPIKEKRTWLKLGNLSWESTKTADIEGKLVLLQNLDPTLTSAEVKDIIWYAFEEKCMAKMVQHCAMSSPHNGQALLIFDTREIAERVLKGLEDKCLMLQNQRPLVGCTVLLAGHPRNQTAFVGHLSIDKVRRPTQREMKEAVSTSHYSQPNTIEYGMAMEWWLLQSKSNIWCQDLFEQHKVELKKLVTNLQVK